MYKIIGILLFAGFLTAESRYTLPLNLEKSETAANKAEENKISYRLPDSVKPISYNIELTVYLDEDKERNLTYDGRVQIELEVEKDTEIITLHSQELNIKELSLNTVDKDGKLQPINNILHRTVKDTNFLKISIKDKKKFGKGRYILIIQYNSELSDNLRGFYRSYYINEKKETVWLATTHFEPVGARRAFPCFDEPALKATFNMKITHHNKYKAIFNTKVKHTNVAGETTTTEFEKTPPMSTYLLAFVVSDFEYRQNKVKNFSVYARPNAIQFGDLALNKGEEILKKLEDFTAIPFEKTIGKMDQIAIPQFTAGAMENWGLVTYREESLLFDDKKNTAAEQQGIVETIAHEFAHQWFGDLVSPKWWTYLWLNEGFANFFQSYITEQVETTWRSVEQSVVKSIQTTAFNFDSSNNTHPINHDVESPKEISDIFDSITYQKGGAVIRMMQHYLTDAIFKKGLQQYLLSYKSKSANSDDFFEAVQEVLKKEKIKINIGEVMDAWMNKKGYPIVTVKRDYEKNSMNLSQERFVTYNASAEERKDTVWQIPINYATQNKPEFNSTSSPILLTKSSDIVKEVEAKKDEWIILNKQQTGFYRVNYDAENWKLIIKYLNSPDRENIHPLNRAQLMNDALAFVKEGILDLQTLLELTDYLRNETDYIAWYPAFETFSYLNSKLVNTDHYSGFKEYFLNKSAVLVESVGLTVSEKDDNHIKKLSRSRIISMVCSLEHDECIKTTQANLTNWLNDPTKNPISADLKAVTFCRGLQNANQTLWDTVFNKSKSHEDNKEKEAMKQALSCSNDKKILEWYLHYSLTNETQGNLQKAILNTLENNQAGVDVVLDFVGPNIFKLHWKLDNKQVLIQLINKIGAKITTKEQLAKLESIKNSNLLIPDNLVNEAVILAKSNLNWLEKNNKTLTNNFVEKANNSDKGGVGAITSSLGLIATLLVILFSNNL